MKFGAKSIAYFPFFYLCSIKRVYFNIVGVFFSGGAVMVRNRFAYNFGRFSTMTL